MESPLVGFMYFFLHWRWLRMQNRLLGIHMIVQNEERYLPRCLDSVKSMGSECFITDTGSTDRTPEIARQYGATVLHTRWEDDFAHARNISLPLANTEWILCIDADEYVIQGLEELLKVLPKVHKSVSRLRITIENRIGEGAGERVIFQPVRLFRAHQGYRYAGRIHEQLVRGNTRDGGDKEGDDPVINGSFTCEEDWLAEHEPLAPLRLIHDGYLPSSIAQGHKPMRNLKLLQRELADHPGQPFHLYNVGVTNCQLGHFEQAAEAFSESLLHTPLQAPYRSTLVRDYAKLLLAMGRYDETHGLLAVERQRYTGYADLHLLYGEVLEQQGLEERAYNSYARAANCREGIRGTDFKDDSKVEIRGIHQKTMEQKDDPESDEIRASKSLEDVHREPIGMERHYVTDYVTDVGCDSYKAYTAMGRLAQKRGFLQESAHLYSLALGREITHTPAWTGLADVLQQSGETDESIAETLLARWKEHSTTKSTGRGGVTREDGLMYVVHALASCGAYGQALNVLHGDERNMRIRSGEYLYWLLCANRVSDALHYMRNQWSDELSEVKSLQPEQRMDVALTCWVNELSVSDSFMATAEPQEREGWRILNGLLDVRKQVHVVSRDEETVHQALSTAATELSKNILIRAVQTGQLTFARKLYEKIVAIKSLHGEADVVPKQWLAAVLYRQGYTMAAADLLIQCMSEGDLDAESLFYLGEALSAKGHYDQALILFQQALDRDSEQRESRAGAAICYMRLALGVIRQELNHSPADRVLMAQQVLLEQQLRTAEGIPWRTVFHARERRNQLANQAHFIMHDRKG